jgi:hypothetical protein
MLIIALVLALIGLVALVFAVVTSNELVAWVCIGASVLGVVLLIIDALRERQGQRATALDTDEASVGDPETAVAGDEAADFVDYPDEAANGSDQEPTPSEDAVTDATDASEEPAAPADGGGKDSAE